MNREDKVWFSYIGAFAAPLLVLGFLVLREKRRRRRSD